MSLRDNRPRDQPHLCVSTALAGRFFTTNTIWKVLYEGPQRSQKFIEPKSINRMVGVRGLKGGWLVFNGNRVSFGIMTKFEEMAGGDGLSNRGPGN